MLRAQSYASELRACFREVSDALSTIGLPLGGSEDWADRLYIVTKGGALLFDDDELDMAEEAQKRMEVRDGTRPGPADTQRTRPTCRRLAPPPHTPLRAPATHR